jgi:exopolysaccharide production protein ExoZ
MKQIGAIQILRAVAALMIVFSHGQNDALNEAIKAGGTFARLEILPWDSGVDLFFVISGFIMVHASQRLFARPGASGSFILRRLIRIVPLYWLITALTLGILAYVAWLGKRVFPDFSEIAASLGFVPFARPEDGQPRPLVPLGWTLNYEMFFYVVFAFFVRFRHDMAIGAVALTLILAVCMGAILRPTATAIAYWSDPIVLEFVLGMLTAFVWHRGFRLDRVPAVLLFSVGMATLALDLDGMARSGPVDVDANGFSRLLGCGLPMALIFGAIVLAEPSVWTRSRLVSFLVFLGNASYALYLSHPLVVIFARKAYLAFGLSRTIGFWPLITADILFAVVLALIVHVFVEKPISARLQRWLVDKKVVGELRVHVTAVRQN